MDFALTDEQAELQKVLRRFLTRYSSEAAVREQLEDPAGYDRELWRRMAGELGLQGLVIPEKFGGGGFTFVERGLVLEELGRALPVPPFFGSCVKGASLIEALGDDALSSESLPGIPA